MKITFAGVGAAFTTIDYYQSNILITANTGKTLLIDCGSDIRFSLGELGIHAGNFSEQIDAIYVSHLHSDHIGGLEWVAFNTYFNPNAPMPKLFISAAIIDELWNNALKGGLKCISGKNMALSDYFDCFPVHDHCFCWENITFTLWEMPHVLCDEENHFSYGLMMSENDTQQTVFFSTDTIFQPNILEQISDTSALIFHDTETALFPSGVHAHYSELATLPQHIKKKMWLYHYQPNPGQDPIRDGFQGFVAKGQVFQCP